MKLTTFLLIASLMQVSAGVYSQSITVQKKNASIEQVFVLIEEQTGYRFLYDYLELQDAAKISINLKNASIEEALNACLKGQPFTYKIFQKTIVLKRKEKVQFETVLPPVNVRGKITDEKGEPLPGATVRVKGTTIAVAADVNGAFSLNNLDESAILVVSYTSFITREIPIKGQSNIQIALKEDPQGLNEVVVVGYGTVLKRDLTGAVGQVDVADLQRAPVKSFDEALAGRVAGVQAASADGQPGSNFNITIRGNNSLTQDNSPLYVIDGFPIEASNNDVINPNDIESIEILKDASATAIYGARGANGVILITTKTGKVGAPVVSYKASLGFQNNIKTMELLNAYDFVKLQHEMDPTRMDSIYLTKGRTLETYRNVPAIDWQDQVFRNAPMQDHNLSLNGGTEKTQYAVSGSIVDQQGIIISSGFKRYQGRLVLTQKINDKLKVNVNANYSNLTSNGVLPAEGTNSATNGLLYSVWGYRPLSGSGTNLSEVLFDPDIDGSNDYRVNPILSAKNELRKSTTNNLIVNSYAQYAFNKYLTLKVSGGIRSNLRQNDRFYNSLTYYGNPSSAGGVNGVNGSVIYTHNNGWLNENTLTYNRKFNKVHSFNILGGVTMQGDTYKNYGFAAIQVPNESLGLNGLDEGVPQRVDAAASNSTLMSFLGRINYNFKSKYLATVSFRSDGSSKFASGKRWSYFPSGSFAWRMSSENFMKSVNFIDDAKLRIGYGLTGNNRVGDFSYLSVLGMPTTSPYAFNNTINLGAVPLALGNPDLKWETTKQTNIGYDLALLKNRISFTADYYRKTTYDLLLNADLPYTTGYDNAFKNIGKVRNQGFEFSLSTVNVALPNFKWSSDFNISFNRSKVLELTQNQSSMLSSLAWENSFKATPLYVAEVNGPISMFYGYVWDGVYQYEHFNQLPSGAYILKDNIPDNGNVRGTIQPGDIKYKDLNGDGKVNTSDQTIIGRGEPIHVGGFNNNFSYKGFDLNVFFQWSYGNDIYNANRMLFEGNILDKLNLNQYASFADRWTPENPSNTMYRVNGQGPKVYSSRVIEDGSFLRLKTVSLGYNFGQTTLQKVKLKSLKVYASAQNLVTWTNYSGMDPEVSVRNSALTPGFDYSAYPRARTIVLGISTSL